MSRARVAYVLFVLACGCRSSKPTAQVGDAGTGSSNPLDAGAATAAMDAGATEAAAGTPHVPSEAERAYLRKLRALAYKCKSGHDEIACTEGRLRAIDAFSGVHCGHDAVAPDLRFAWATIQERPDATIRPVDDVFMWVEERSAAVADDIDRIDQEPTFYDSRKNKLTVADSYDGNNVVGGELHIRLRRPLLSAAEVARVRGLAKRPADVELLLLQGKKIVAKVGVDPTSVTEKRLTITHVSAELCKPSENWQQPDDLEGAFDPAPP